MTSLYVPATHAAHANPSGPVYPMLHVQLVMSLLPLPEYVCAGQALHVASDVSPVSVLYLPCRHREQGAEPFSSLYLPLAQALQFCPSGAVYPALHMQTLLPLKASACMGHAVHVVSAASPVSALYLPLEHRRHALEPLTSLYFPLWHAEHSWPSGPVYPRLQVQFKMLLLPSSEYVWFGQVLHVASDTAATSVENVPWGHKAQASDPLTSLYRPAAQGWHGPPSGPE